MEVKGLAQGPHSGNMAVLGFELSTFQILALNLHHCPQYDLYYDPT